MNLSRQDGPIYQQIASVLRAELGQYQPGDFLPSEMRLAERFQVNRHTVRGALQVLEQESCILRIKGKGAQVLGSLLVYPLSQNTAYSSWFEANGHNVRTCLVAKRTRLATAVEVKHLALKEGDSLLEFKTLRFLEGEAVSLISHCFAQRHQLMLEQYQNGSMRDHLRSYGHELERVFSAIGARLPRVDEAARLRMAINQPVLTVETLSKDQHGHPIELAFTVSRSDRFRYHVVM